MDPSFWKQAWSEGRIGFHEGAPNTFLTAHATRLTGTRVLVPLCGKTEDLAFLASRGHEVIGVELVEDAVQAFFAEHGLQPNVEPRGPLTSYRAAGITIFAGDFFAVTPDHVGTIDAVYDRAALIALPPDLRTRYIAHLKALAPAATPVLLVTLTYPQDKYEGPPFSVDEAEVRRHYATAEVLDERVSSHGRLAAAGVHPAERIYAATL